MADQFHNLGVEDSLGNRTTVLVLREFAMELVLAERLSSVISPSIDADQDDWNPTGLSSTRIIRITATGADRAITGVLAQPSAQVTFINVGTNLVTFKPDDAASAAPNRILTGGIADIDLAANDNLTMWYDNDSSRWRVLSVIQ